MRRDDIEAAYRVASFALAGSEQEVLDRSPEEKELYLSRFRHYLDHDPNGSFVATDGHSEVVGVSVALLRNGLWVLALLAVSEEAQGGGIGRSLMKHALDYGGDFTEGMIAASTHPAALRTYSNSGFALHPTFTAKGKLRRENVPPDLEVREGDASDLDLAARVDRRLRGAAHGPDLENILSGGARMLVIEEAGGEGYAFSHGENLWLLGATDEGVAARLLWAYLAACEPDSDLEVRWITARQNWAMRALLDAGLDLHPDGPVCVKGSPGPLAPYLPSGSFL